MSATPLTPHSPADAEGPAGAAAGAPPSGSRAGDRVPTRQKVGYGLGSLIDMWGHWLYPSLAFHVFNVFLGVAPGLISTAQMIKIFVDAGSDALFGWISDNTRTRYGRRRPFILVGGVLAGIGLPLMFAVGRGWTDTQYFIFMVVSTIIYVPVMSCFNMPWLSLGAEMTPDYHERTRVMQARNAIQKAPELAMFFAAQFTTLAIFRGADGKPDILLGAQTYCAILGAIMVAVSIIMFFVVRERYYVSLVARTQSHIPFADTLWRTLRCKPFRYVLLMMLAYGMGTAMVAALGYYATVYYVCHGDVALATKWNTAMGLSGMVFGFLGIPFFGSVAKRHGKRAALALVLILAICAFIGDWWLYDPARPALQLLACGFVAFTGAGFWTLYGSTVADVVDYDELQTGQRREGSFSACQSWISKVGIALGVGASGWILQFTGFDSKLPAQSEHAIFMIRILLSGIPVIGLVLALVALMRFELTEKRMLEIRDALEAQRGVV
ncbi:MFS transporter [Roseateles amylovorans]|uniref:MFS transporter n=1 Tax=Roseateles amylovorans TaxID=2978473 RepID=A0ABY6B6A9_9BURK|nr:MFS transporter [Roseateles amylovorans]UXH80710.1 MFS transporter [Roseateles amylovorans]